MKFHEALQSLSIPSLNEQQFWQKSDLNVLFIHPEATGANFYRMFAPFWVLKNTGVVNTAMSGWSKYNPIKRLRTDEKFPIRSLHILWADTIVFPFTNQPLKDFYEVAKTINPKCKIVFHVDFDFTDIPAHHPLASAFDGDAIRNTLENAVYSDLCVVTNPLLATRLIARSNELGYEMSREKLSVQLLCYDEEVFLWNTNVNAEKKPDAEYFNLLVLANDNQLSDLKTALPMIRAAKEKHGNKLKIIFFGVNKNKEPFARMVKGLEYIPEKAVPVWEYYPTLNRLNADMVLLPHDGSEWSQRSHDYKRFVDCGLLRLPVITPKYAPFEVVVKHGETGYLYQNKEEFMSIIDKAVADKSVLLELSANINATVEQNFLYTTDKLQKLINLLG